MEALAREGLVKGRSASRTWTSPSSQRWLQGHLSRLRWIRWSGPMVAAAWAPSAMPRPGGWLSRP